MQTRNFNQEPEFKAIPSIEKAVELLKTDHTQAIMMSLNPGNYIAKHTAGMEVSFFLAEGELDFEYGEDVQKITAGTMVQGDKVMIQLHGMNRKKIMWQKQQPLVYLLLKMKMCGHFANY